LNAVREELATLALPPGVHWDMWTPDRLSLPVAYHRSGSALAFIVRGHGVSAEQHIEVGVKKAGAKGAAFLMVTGEGSFLPIELREVYPVFSTVFTIKLRTWADGVVRDLLARFDREARRTLRAPE
jgi:hypothetical protein